MTINCARKYVGYAREYGEVKFCEDGYNYLLGFDRFTSQYSLRYFDGTYWQTIKCTSKVSDLCKLLQA